MTHHAGFGRIASVAPIDPVSLVSRHNQTVRVETSRGELGELERLKPGEDGWKPNPSLCSWLERIRPSGPGKITWANVQHTLGGWHDIIRETHAQEWGGYE